MIRGFLLKVDDPATGRISELELREPWPARVQVVPGDLVLGLPEGPEPTHHIEIESFLHNGGPTPKPCLSCASFELGPGERFRILVPQKDFWGKGGFFTVTATDSSGGSAQIVLEVVIDGTD